MIYRIGLVLLSAALFGCGSSGSSENSESASAPEPAPMEASGNDLAMSGEGYAITVLDAQPASPRKEMRGTVAGVGVVVNYGSPSVKGRPIYGELEPYDQVWRAGANEATRITFEEDVLVEGEPLAAGTYGFFIIPTEGAWTAIFNNVAEQWGAYEYDEGQDALRVNAEPRMLDSTQETLEYFVAGNSLVMRWARAELPLRISAAVQ